MLCSFHKNGPEIEFSEIAKIWLDKFRKMKYNNSRKSRHATVAQLVEQLIRNQQVAGSSPASSSTFTEIKTVNGKSTRYDVLCFFIAIFYGFTLRRIFEFRSCILTYFPKNRTRTDAPISYRNTIQSRIFPSAEIVNTCHGMNFPLFCNAFFAAFSSPPQQGTSMRTTVTLLISFPPMISASLSE